MKVISFSRYRSDPPVLLIPDAEFIETNGHQKLRLEIDNADNPWEDKLNEAIWRGSNHGIGYTCNMYSNKNKAENQRLMLINLYQM